MPTSHTRDLVSAVLISLAAAVVVDDNDDVDDIEKESLQDPPEGVLTRMRLEFSIEELAAITGRQNES